MPRRAMVKIKPRRYKKGDIVTVATVIMHPMETGMRKDKKTGKVIPAHYITDVEVYYGDERVTYMKTTSGLSANPFIAFKLRGRRRTVQQTYGSKRKIMCFLPQS